MAERVDHGSWGKIALIAVVAIEVIGVASGLLSNSGFANPWFDSLRKPSFMPPGIAFGLLWPVLYALLGIALAMVFAEPPSPRRKTALILFFIQLALNFAWSPLFFGVHAITFAKWVIFVMAALSAAAAGQFFRINRTAGLLLVPYFMWLLFAATLNATIEQLNPERGVALLGVG